MRRVRPFHPLRGTALLAATLATLSWGCGESERRPEAGANLYAVYCASCHGLAGRGDGPVAISLTPAPSDLTRIALRNAGRFDEHAVLSAIDGRYEVAAHGPRDMPVWGAEFVEAHRDDPFPVHRGMDDARALVDFLETIQVTDEAGGKPAR